MQSTLSLGRRRIEIFGNHSSEEKMRSQDLNSDRLSPEWVLFITPCHRCWSLSRKGSVMAAALLAGLQSGSPSRLTSCS